MRATSYADSIKIYQRTNNWRGAWLALSNKYDVRDKLESEIDRHKKLLHTRLCKGQIKFTLDRFITQHRNACFSMQTVADHVTYQLPNDNSKVGYLLTEIQDIDNGFHAMMDSTKTEKGPGVIRNNLEASASHLLLYDLVK